MAEAKKRQQENPNKYLDHIYGEKEVGGANHLYLSAMQFNKLGLPTLKEEAPAEFSEKIQHTIYKGFIAPVALYGTLCFIAIKNMKGRDEAEQNQPEHSKLGEKHDEP